jgi:general secretion pathway protein E
MSQPSFESLREPSSPSPRSVAELRAAVAGPLAQRLSPKYLAEHCLVPLEVDAAGALIIAAGVPLDPTVLDELCWTYGRRVRVVPAPAAELQSAILSVESAAVTTDAATADLRGADLELLTQEDEALDDLRALASQAPVIKLVNVLILEALRSRASDIHLESTAEGLRVRYRIDGVLHDISRPPRQYQAAVISRIKIMANLNIAERRVAQDGRIRLRLSDRELDLRVSVTPSLHGESVVLRILDRSGTGGVRDLADIGMTGRVLSTFEQLIGEPHGIVLVTGPTGSGKTTTLYAALRKINQPGVKIIAVEDPVEYQIDGVTQIPVNTKTGLTFASALRSILRHDPDVIMVGEMRDRETAEIAIQAALTGHLVFSTLHTNDAPSAITRMVDMGIEPYLVAATVRGIVAQRLVRVVCEQCAVADEPAAQDLAGADIPKRTPPRFRRGTGCETCAQTGYRGRTGIYELLQMNDDTRERVVAGGSLGEIRALGEANGLVPLRAAGWLKAYLGITTVDEVLRVTHDR